MALRLDGKTAIVTGAGSGFGVGIARHFAREGGQVMVADINKDGAEAVAAEIGGIAHHVNVADRDSVAKMASAAADAFGDLDILVNNAGIIRRADALDFSGDDWDEVMSTNLKSPFFMAQAAARSMVATNRPGKIINIASLLSLQGGIRVASYTASKSGLAGLTRLLANEWAGWSINVNAIVPGYFATNNTEALRQDEVRNSQILDRIPAGRWGKPDDLAGAIVFLASSASDYVHGALIPVDGGWLAR